MFRLTGLLYFVILLFRLSANRCSPIGQGSFFPSPPRDPCAASAAYFIYTGLRIKVKTPETPPRFYYFYIMFMYISEGNNNVFTHILGKFALITGYADHEINMELLADLLNLFNHFLKLVRLHAGNLKKLSKYIFCKS